MNQRFHNRLRAQKKTKKCWYKFKLFKVKLKQQQRYWFSAGFVIILACDKA